MFTNCSLQCGSLNSLRSLYKALAGLLLRASQLLRLCKPDNSMRPLPAPQLDPSTSISPEEAEFTRSLGLYRAVVLLQRPTIISTQKSVSTPPSLIQPTMPLGSSPCLVRPGSSQHPEVNTSQETIPISSTSNLAPSPVSISTHSRPEAQPGRLEFSYTSHERSEQTVPSPTPKKVRTRRVLRQKTKIPTADQSAA